LANPLPRTVWILAAISFANDAASEMLTPLLPVFLVATLGAGPAAVGVVEGAAQATASLLQLVSGRLADRGFGTRRLMLAGYGVSNVARPAIAAAIGWPWVLAMRFLDRVGKGLRTAPRDALLATATSEVDRGRAFGLQRSLDHAGAVIGPAAAFALLASGVEMRTVFWLSAIPGLAVVALVAFGLPRDGVAPARPAAASPSWRGLDARLRALVVAAGLLAFAAVPEAFLVLWATERGVAVAQVPLLWAVAHGVKAVVAARAGRFSDRAGRMPVVTVGWLARVAVLAWLASWEPSLAGVWVGFLLYAAALASTEGAERALVGDAATAGARGAAFGLYHTIVGIVSLPGGLLFGALWERLGAGAALLASAGLTATAAAALVALARRRPTAAP